MITTSLGHRLSRRAEHGFYVGMTVVVIAIAFAGFAKSYYLGSYFHAPALPLITKIHGAALATHSYHANAVLFALTSVWFS